MRKLLLLPICIGVFLVDFSAFAANARGGRGTANTANANASSAPVAARAAVRGANKSTTTSSSAVSARAAKKATASVVSAAPKNTSAVGKTTAARAGAKQKVINMGTKVTAATENTVVSKECQDLYFGCMDAFCMLDNASGGRCQCSDKIKELDDLLATIISMTEQSQIMATEGVERLKMGQNAEEIIARAKSAADAISLEQAAKKGEADAAKKQALDLSAWNKSWYDDDIDEFEETPVPSDFSKKTGDSLYASAAQLCNKQIPVQCKSSAAMLQMVYGQKIKSDCTAYDNSLKQQQSEASQKLISAQKDLRDAALEQFQDENKYDLGGCTIEFKQCMQDTGGCGDDFSGCVADVVTLNIGRTQSLKLKKITTGAAYVEIEPMTYDILESKKPICDSVLKHCVKVADQVWGTFLREVAATIRLAEVNAESDRRMLCVSTVADCVRKSCGSQWDEKSDNYDMCLSNPDSVKQFCSIEMEKCGDTDLTETIMTYVTAKLNAMRVDRCTMQVKDCLENEDVCGKDYSGCLGLSSDSILDLCPVAKLTACMDKFDESSAKNYVISIAQGLALNIDNKMSQQCQNAVTAATVKVCGGEDDCSSVTMDPEALVSSVFKYEICPISNSTGKQNGGVCRDTVESITNDDIEREIQRGNKYQPRFFRGDLARAVRLQMRTISQTSGSTQREEMPLGTKKQVEFVQGEISGIDEDYQKTLGVLIGNMNQNLSMVMTSIENDPTVNACLNGKQFSSFTGNGGTAQARFSNLTENTRQVIAMQLYNKILNKYTDMLKEVQNKRDNDAILLVTKYAQTAKDREAACKQMAEDMNMDTDAYKVSATATYSDKGSQQVAKEATTTIYVYDSDAEEYVPKTVGANRATDLNTTNPTCTLIWTEWRCIDWHTKKNRCEHDADASYRKTYMKQCDMFKGDCSQTELFNTEG